MAETSLTCPYCNTLFDPASAGSSPRGRTCPRCGEPLPAEMQASVTTVSSTPVSEAQTPSGLSNRAIGVTVLSIMIVMAVVGLAFALWTQDFRRRNDFKVTQEAPQIVPSPAEWAALGYVPAKSNLLAGIQVTDVVSETPGNTKLLDPPRPAIVETLVKQLEKWTGLRLQGIDHVILAVSLDDNLPQGTVALRTRQPYRHEELARTTQAARVKDLHGKPLYAFEVQLVKGRLWCPDDQTIVLVLRI